MGTPFIGEIKIISWNFPPKGWAFCDGQLLPINQNQALFSLFGTTYGGNGQTTFALPDLRGKVPVHIGTGFVQGQTGGETAHTLTTPEMPAHTHGASGNTAGSTATLTNNYWAADPYTSYSTSPPDSAMHSSAIGNLGGSQPHENMPPYLVLNFIVALQGAFPSRT